MKRDILLVLFVVLALIAVVMLMRGPEEQVVEENVYFEVTNIFIYGENNPPIENLILLFPCPNVDNEPTSTYSTWALYYGTRSIENLQVSEARIYEFKGQRTETLGILSRSRVSTPWGPKIQYVLDKLYPQEILEIKVFTYVPKNISSKVTIRNYGDAQGRSSMHYENWYPPEWRINLSFWSRLSKGTDGDNLETFYNSVENASAGSGIWLYPI